MKKIINNQQRLSGAVKLPQSKSYLHRYLLTALAHQKFIQIHVAPNSLAAEDVQATSNLLKKCGVKITYNQQYHILKVDPQNISQPKEAINCLESASTLRIGVFVLLGLFKEFEITGSEKLLNRPLDFLETFCLENQIICEYQKNKKNKIEKIKLIRNKTDFLNQNIIVEKCESSQYLSGLMIARSVNRTNVDSTLTLSKSVESIGYLDITNEVLKQLKIDYQKTITKSQKIEFKLSKEKPQNKRADPIFEVPIDSSNQAFWEVLNFFNHQVLLPKIDLIQPDSIIQFYLSNRIKKIDFQKHPDLFPIMMVYAVCSQEEFIFTGYNRNKIKESNRVLAVVSQLQELGANIFEEEKRIIIKPSQKLNGGEVCGFNDHRIVMSFVIYALITKQKLVVSDALAVNKSYPNFWEDLKGLGGINE